MVYANRYWNATGTRVVAVERRDEQSAQSQFIIVFSKLGLMISLCPGCHAKVERTKMVLLEINPLLLMLWRERHPKAQEQVMLDFNIDRQTGTDEG